MQEEADLDVLLLAPYFLPQQSWEQHEMVIVYPDQIAILHILGNGLREEFVRLSVRVPGIFRKRYLARMIMEQWPENGVFYVSTNVVAWSVH